MMGRDDKVDETRNGRSAPVENQGSPDRPGTVSRPRPVRDMEWPTGTHIYCLGSPHGDDQIGWRVGERLRQVFPEAASAVHLLKDVWQLVDFLGLSRRAIVIDAFEIREELSSVESSKEVSAGTVLQLTWPDPRLEDLRSHSTHGGSVAEALQLAEAVQRLPRVVTILGVAAWHFAPTADASADVRSAIPELLQRIEAEFAGWRDADRSGGAPEAAAREDSGENQDRGECADRSESDLDEEASS
jgi:hydrogenase maturation protease